MPCSQSACRPVRRSTLRLEVILLIIQHAILVADAHAGDSYCVDAPKDWVEKYSLANCQFYATREWCTPTGGYGRDTYFMRIFFYYGGLFVYLHFALLVLSVKPNACVFTSCFLFSSAAILHNYRHWNKTWGQFELFRGTSEKTAVEACCACGGGQKTTTYDININCAKTMRTYTCITRAPACANRNFQSLQLFTSLVQVFYGVDHCHRFCSVRLRYMSSCLCIHVYSFFEAPATAASQRGRITLGCTRGHP